MKRLACAVAFGVVAAAGSATAEVSVVDRFNLWNECRPLELAVELDKDAIDIGLSQDASETAARSRLRAARLYSEDALSLLYVDTNVLNKAFNLNVFYFKRVRDIVSGEVNIAITWQDIVIGTHAGNGNYIVSLISQRVDKFIDEYLRVNADACN